MRHSCGSNLIGSQDLESILEVNAEDLPGLGVLLLTEPGERVTLKLLHDGFHGWDD